jgi:hypothetical protein
MTVYSLVLFLHVGAALALASALSIDAISVPNNFLPSSAVSQFPTRTPNRRTPFTPRMPAARSELRSPQSDASYASRRIAASLKLIVDGAIWVLFKCDSVPRDHGLVERKARLRAVPVDEFANGMVVRAL